MSRGPAVQVVKIPWELAVPLVLVAWAVLPEQVGQVVMLEPVAPAVRPVKEALEAWVAVPALVVDAD